jgi:hypothetical protein
MTCCPHPDFDGEMCQTCFDKPRKITSPNGSAVFLRSSSSDLVDELKGLLLYGDYPGGYSNHAVDAFRYSLLAAGFEDEDRLLKSPVGRVGYAIWAAGCAVVVVGVAYLVACFMGQ